MLSIEEVREHLPNGQELTDEEAEKIRDDLYTLANICFDMWAGGGGVHPKKDS